MQRAFTVIELIYVVVILAILSTVAIPKFTEVGKQAQLAKAKSDVAAIQSVIVAERQKLILRGSPKSNIVTLEDSSGMLFNGINGDTDNPVLESHISPCSGNQEFCWTKSGTTYTYKAGEGVSVDFTLRDNRFDCRIDKTPSGNLCKYFSR